MSDAIKKLRGIRQIPIFPLPLVLLPNELLPLHIFEPRYRQMLRDIEAGNRLFGVVRFEPDDLSTERPEEGAIGCVAELRESEQLPDGRSNILTFGAVRFRIVEYVETDAPYRVADVDFFSDDPEKAEDVAPLADEVFELFQRMAKAAFRMSGGRGIMPEIRRTDAESLSFLITAAFNFDNDKKYRLLAMTSTTNRLAELKEMLDQAVKQIEKNVDIQAISRTNGHGPSKIDL